MTGIVSTKIYDLLKKVTGNIDNYSITLHDSNKKGEGFLGEMSFVSITEKSSGDTTHFVVKQAFSEEKVRESHPIRKYFLNEIHFYTKLWPQLNKFQANRGLSQLFNKIPKCFITSTEFEHEKLILENLRYQGFQIYDKRRPFDEEHMNFVLKQYGKFHALSFAYKSLYPQEYCEITKDLEDLFGSFPKIKSVSGFLTYVFEISLKSLDPQEDGQAISKFKPYVENGVDVMCSKSEYYGNYSVALHGDCWSNNMMFKYNEHKELCDMRLIDFQFAKVGTPVSDLSYCFYSGGSKEMFDHLDDYLKVYHNSLLETLEECGVDSVKNFPFEALRKDWKEYCQTGFIMALMIWRGKLIYDDSIIDFTDMEDSEETLTEDFKATKFDEETFRIRSRDLIVHMAENDFL